MYILQSKLDHKLYIGSTGNLRRRVIEHQEGRVVSTKHRRPLTLLCYEAYQEKQEAQAREKFLKSSDGKK
ncbi:MAG TPA: GIY-YIG nuclease family protein, partial [Candidatus Andersenbacteria bacterium]|nr:GIY-YIG nuclease family protein [Candidatus Andersenbacteria bacterium]